LVDACLRLPGEDWQLTMIGADTATAPMGQSVQMTIEAMWGEDPRLRLQDPVPHEELQTLWAEHDLLVVPSRFEVWSNVALEACERACRFWRRRSVAWRRSWSPG
jgi:hypothetical protein